MFDFRRATAFSFATPHRKAQNDYYVGGNNSVVKCPPLNQKVGCSIHWVTCRSAPWARAFTSAASARRKIQASACRHQK